MAREGVLGEFTRSHPNFSLFSQASTCALDDPKGPGILQRSGRGCESCRAIVAGLLPPCCCALCWKWDLWVCIKIKVSQGKKNKGFAPVFIAIKARGLERLSGRSLVVGLP